MTPEEMVTHYNEVIKNEKKERRSIIKILERSRDEWLEKVKKDDNGSS